MVDRSILKIIKQYLAALPKMGIHPTRAILYGSYSRGDANEWSDIDIVVIAPEFDGKVKRKLVEDTWLATKYADDRIEPVPCGVKEWDNVDSRPIIDIARRDGVVVEA
ncbi:MAG: nucleotidyltransferase domain-containing protein [Candidatus Hatepunaea meridiana]|nr:nucleotidyltransferase domain-containing protein [Candidatus Hatepunaea meridiana]